VIVIEVVVEVAHTSTRQGVNLRAPKGRNRVEVNLCHQAKGLVWIVKKELGVKEGGIEREDDEEKGVEMRVRVRAAG